MATATTYGARAHARRERVPARRPCPSSRRAPGPRRPARRASWCAGGDGDGVRLHGNYTHKVLARGTELRLTDLRGQRCAHLLLYAASPWERLNVADTVKVQWNAYLGEGQLLLSGPGPRPRLPGRRHLPGRHDTLCGTSTLVRNTQRYGDGTRSPPPAGRELFKLAAAKNGLEPRRPAPPRSPSSREWRSVTTARWTSPVRRAPAAA